MKLLKKPKPTKPKRLLTEKEKMRILIVMTIVAALVIGTAIYFLQPYTLFSTLMELQQEAVP